MRNGNGEVMIDGITPLSLITTAACRMPMLCSPWMTNQHQKLPGDHPGTWELRSTWRGIAHAIMVSARDAKSQFHIAPPSLTLTSSTLVRPPSPSPGSWESQKITNNSPPVVGHEREPLVACGVSWEWSVTAVAQIMEDWRCRASKNCPPLLLLVLGIKRPKNTNTNGELTPYILLFILIGRRRRSALDCHTTL